MGNIITIILDVFCVFVASGLCPLPPSPPPAPIRTVAPKALADEPMAPTRSPAPVGRRRLEYDGVHRDNEIRTIEVMASEIKKLNDSGQFQFDLFRPCRDANFLVMNQRRLVHAECTSTAWNAETIYPSGTGDDATVILSRSSTNFPSEEVGQKATPTGAICRVTCASKTSVGFE